MQIDDTADIEPENRSSMEKVTAKDNVYQHISSVYSDKEETATHHKGNAL